MMKPKCETCFAELPVTGRDPVLLRPVYAPCVKCAEGRRDFLDDGGAINGTKKGDV